MKDSFVSIEFPFTFGNFRISFEELSNIFGFSVIAIILVEAALAQFYSSAPLTTPLAFGFSLLDIAFFAFPVVDEMVVEEAKPEAVTDCGFSFKMSYLMISFANLGI